MKTLSEFKHWHALLVNCCGTDDIGVLSSAVHKLPKEFLPPAPEPKYQMPGSSVWLTAEEYHCDCPKTGHKGNCVWHPHWQSVEEPEPVAVQVKAPACSVPFAFESGRTVSEKFLVQIE